MDWKLPARFLLVFLLLYFLYSAGFSLTYVAIIGAISIPVILLRGRIYKKIDKALIGKFPFISRWPSWARMLLVVVIFIVIYALLKQILFELLKTANIDIQEALTDGLNNSLNE
ncbi:MAG: hypothetical protein ABH863_02460 [Candidatus Micrarchaeota archaeon]